jgi:hypothetical protein
MQLPANYNPLYTRNCDDFEEFAEALLKIGWDIRTEQLDRGAFRTEKNLSLPGRR